MIFMYFAQFTHFFLCCWLKYGNLIAFMSFINVLNILHYFCLIIFITLAFSNMFLLTNPLLLHITIFIFLKFPFATFLQLFSVSFLIVHWVMFNCFINSNVIFSLLNNSCIFLMTLGIHLKFKKWIVIILFTYLYTIWQTTIELLNKLSQH